MHAWLDRAFGMASTMPPPMVVSTLIVRISVCIAAPGSPWLEGIESIGLDLSGCMNGDCWDKLARSERTSLAAFTYVRSLELVILAT
jgi:hypothetical protein